MEKRIKKYEEFIAKRLKNPDAKLMAYHREMLANFQHERLVHLIIMLFFVVFTLALSVVCVLAMSATKNWLTILPTILATIIMWILSACYVRHYYFLENHIQALYDTSAKLYENYATKNSVEDVGAELGQVGQKIVKKVGKMLTKKEEK